VNGLPEAYAQMGLRGYDLESVLHNNYEIEKNEEQILGVGDISTPQRNIARLF